eukprot:gene9142-biopygen21205
MRAPSRPSYRARQKSDFLTMVQRRNVVWGRASHSYCHAYDKYSKVILGWQPFGRPRRACQPAAAAAPPPPPPRARWRGVPVAFGAWAAQ